MALSVIGKFFRWLAIACVFLVCAVALALWQLDRSMPSFALRRLERRLSEGAMSYRFERASLNLLKGVTLSHVRVHLKRTLGAPLVKADEMRMEWDVDQSRPVYVWAKRVFFKGLEVRPFLEFPDNPDGSDVDLAAILRDVSIDHDWLVEPRQVAVERAKIFGIACKFVSFDLAVREGVLHLDNVRIVPETFGFIESLTGELDFDPARKRVHAVLAGTLTPDVIRELTLFLEGEEAVEYYDAITDLSSPLSAMGEIDCVVAEGGERPPISDLRVTLSGGGFKYRGRPVRRAKFGLQWLSDSAERGETARRLVLSPIDADFVDGTLFGKIAWYPDSHATDFLAESTLPAKSLLQVIDLPYPSCMTNMSFDLPTANVSGRLYFGEREHQSAIGGRMSAAKAVFYGVETRDCSTHWSLTGNNLLSFDEITGSCHDGSVTGRVAVAFSSEEESIDLSLGFNGVRTDPVRALFAPVKEPTKGKVSGHVSLAGPLDTARLGELTGDAWLEIRDAALMRVPLFAGLTDFLGRNVMGVDLLVMQSDADMTMSLTNGLMTVDRLAVSGNLLSIIASGKCRINAPETPCEGVAQVRFFHSRSLIGRLARLVTLPVSKLMEFRVHGPVENPHWDYIGIIDRIADATFRQRRDDTEVKPEEPRNEDGSSADPPSGDGGAGEEKTEGH